MAYFESLRWMKPRLPALAGACRVVAVALVGSIGACSSDSVPTLPPVVDPDVSTFALLQIDAPLPGEIFATGNTIDLVVETGGLAVGPTLFANDVVVPVKWTPDTKDPSILHAPFTVPSSPTAFIMMEVAAPNARPASTFVRTPPPVESLSAIAGATDTLIALPSGPRLIIPGGTITGNVTFASYQSSVIYADGSNLITPVFRVHTDTDNTELKGAMVLEVPISPVTAQALDGQLAMLDVYEGEDPDPEAPPFSTRASVVTNNNTSVLRADLDAIAFHHTGSGGIIMGIWKKAYPFAITSALVTGATSADIKSGTPTIKLSNAGVLADAHLTLDATVEWTKQAPSMTLPVADAPTSPFSSLRSKKGTNSPTDVYRQHKGIDLGSADNTVLNAAISGKATLNFKGQYAIVIRDATSGFNVRYFHVSNVTHDFVKMGVGQGKRLGDRITASSNTCTINCPTFPSSGVVTAPQAGNYSLDCQQIPWGPPRPADQKRYVLLGCDPVLINGNTATRAYTTGDCSSTSKKNCIGYVSESDGYTMQAVAGKEVGRTGHTSRDQMLYGPHLHYEVWFGGISQTVDSTVGIALDPALFHPTISTAVNTGVQPLAAVQSPVVRMAAQLDDPLTGGAILGIDPQTLQAQSAAPCPYGDLSTIPGYAVTSVAGQNNKTIMSWDFGGCVAQQLVNYSVNGNTCSGKTVKFVFGTTSWWQEGTSPWLYLDRLPAPSGTPGEYANPTTLNPKIKALNGPQLDGISATIACCDPANDPTCAVPPLTAKSFEGMKVTVQGLNGEFATSTMTLTNVASVASVAVWQSNHPNEAGTMSGSLPGNAQVYTFLDNAQPAGVVGFPSVFTGNNFANRNGRSNLVAVWQDVNKKWQWVMNISGGSYNSNGGFPQWHEYQFVYDSRPAANPHNRYDVYLGQNAQGMGFTFNRTAKTTVTVSPIPKQLMPFQP